LGNGSSSFASAALGANAGMSFSMSGATVPDFETGTNHAMMSGSGGFGSNAATTKMTTFSSANHTHPTTTLTTTSTEYNQSNGERKEEQADDHVLVVDSSITLLSCFVDSARGDLREHWVVIYAFLGLSFVDRIQMRPFCKLFNNVEILLSLDGHGHKLLKPMPLRVEFPNSKYPSLPDLMNKLNEEYAALFDLIIWEQCTAPELLSVGMKVRAKSVGSGVGQGHGGGASQPASFKDATIQKVNDDETFDVVFVERRRTRKNVPLNELQIPNVSVVDLICFFILFHILLLLSISLTKSLSSLLSFYLLYVLSFFFLSFLCFLFLHIINRRKASWQKRKRTKKRVLNL
jgi:hypothetical protein